MSPIRDDPALGSGSYVLRVLHERGITTKGGRERPQSDSIKDSNFENSCFVEGEIPIEELRLLFGGRRIARIPVQLLRNEGYLLERRPLEAPEGCSRPESHIVCGPPETTSRGEYEAKARRIVRSEEIQII